MAIEYVRVKDKGTRHELSIVRSAYDADPEPYELLEKPAAQADGTPLPAKHHKSLSNRKSGRTSDETEKETP